MFSLNENGTIKLSRGDDSGRIPVFLNKGTWSTPVRYKFSPDVYVAAKTSNLLYIDLNTSKFRVKCPKNGIYSFIYMDENWYLDNNIVNLRDYGIICNYVTILNEDAFLICHNYINGENIQLYIFEVNSTNQDWLVRKTFLSNGVVISEYKSLIPLKMLDNLIINENGDLMILINKSDTDWLDAGEYRYLIRVTIYNYNLNKLETSTVTNKLPLYVIDDDYDRGWY